MVARQSKDCLGEPDAPTPDGLRVGRRGRGVCGRQPPPLVPSLRGLYDPVEGVLVLDCAYLRLWVRLTDIAVACIGLSEGDFEPYRRMALALIDSYLANPHPCQCGCERSVEDSELWRLRAYLRGSA